MCARAAHDITCDAASAFGARARNDESDGPRRLHGREFAFEDPVADPAADEVVEGKDGAGAPGDQGSGFSPGYQTDEAVDAFLDGPDDERRLGRMLPGFAVGIEHLGAERCIHEAWVDDTDVNAVAAQL